ncbi:hypothetical protein [Pedobacter sp. GR22-6]|uniref:hypothetical protein n=1 Tax=Pedobacter sp. GR22-6 TaxID=3127957 RepID=UPI00307DCBFC
MKRHDDNLKRLSGLLTEEITTGAEKEPLDSGQMSDTLSKSQAYRLYGRDNVDRWCKESLIHPVSLGGSGKKKFIDRLKLEAVARASNRMIYLPISDR